MGEWLINLVMAKSLKHLKYEYSALLEQMNDNLREQIKVLDRTQYKLGDGAVYVLRQVGANYYKIGHTTNYEQRKLHFDIRLPFEVEEVYVYKTDNYRAVELKLHENFAAHRLNNSEFFELDDKVVEELPELIAQIDRIIEVSKAEANQDQASSIEGDDELFARVEALMEELEIPKSEVSTSLLQRKLRIGYARAARMKDRLMNE